MKVKLYGADGAMVGSNYCLGIESGYIWCSTDYTGGMKWYASESTHVTPTLYQTANATGFANVGRHAAGTTTIPGSGAYVQTPSLSINGGATIAGHLTGTGSSGSPLILANSVATFTITVTGAAGGDTVTLGPPTTIDANVMWCGSVSSSNTVTVRIVNPTLSSITLTSGTWRADVWQH
jgi:hypothetical protein